MHPAVAWLLADHPELFWFWDGEGFCQFETEDFKDFLTAKGTGLLNIEKVIVSLPEAHPAGNGPLKHKILIGRTAEFLRQQGKELVLERGSGWRPDITVVNEKLAVECGNTHPNKILGQCNWGTECWIIPYPDNYSNVEILKFAAKSGFTEWYNNYRMEKLAPIAEKMRQRKK